MLSLVTVRRLLCATLPARPAATLQVDLQRLLTVARANGSPNLKIDVLADHGGVTIAEHYDHRSRMIAASGDDGMLGRRVGDPGLQRAVDALPVGGRIADVSR